MVPPVSNRVSRVPLYSGSRLPCLSFGYGAFTPYGRLSQNRSPTLAGTLCGPQPRGINPAGWALSRSLAATKEIEFSFSSSGYLDVSVPRVPFRALWIHARMTGVFPAGFPHSEIRGSMGICPSPRLIAACHVFLRLPVPRHPPCALISLTRFSCRLAWRQRARLFRTFSMSVLAS